MNNTENKKSYTLDVTNDYSRDDYLHDVSNVCWGAEQLLRATKGENEDLQCLDTVNTFVRNARRQLVMVSNILTDISGKYNRL